MRGIDAQTYGAVGDGATDDTGALQAALDAAAVGDPLCYLPPGRYRLDGALIVPSGVTLCGASGGVPHSEHPVGAVLLAYGGRGQVDGAPLLTLKPSAVLRNLIVHYPEQTLPDVAPYPWTIRGDGELCQVVDVTLTNPYQALDFGTRWNELHTIRNVFACPLKIGLYIDQCTDIGRVENVHFNPNFWTRMALDIEPRDRDLGARDVRPGDQVTFQAVRRADGTLRARVIGVLSPGVAGIERQAEVMDVTENGITVETRRGRLDLLTDDRTVFVSGSVNPKPYLERNLIGFKIGKTDWEYISNSFVIFPRIGFHLDDFGHGPGNPVIAQSGADICPVAVRVDRVQQHAGVQFVNGQFMAALEVGADNLGPVKLTNCGFWGVPETREQVIKHGPSTLTLTSCHFTGWDAAAAGTPCIRADGGRLVVSGCDFVDPGKQQIALQDGLTAATIYGCLLRGGGGIIDESGADVQIALNTTQ